MLKLTARFLATICMILSCALAYAQDSSGSSVPMTFASWKQQQISEAQGRYQRVVLNRGDEKQLARAREALSYASELTLEEYISVYLVSLQSDRIAMSKLSEKLSNIETADIISSLLRGYNAERKSIAPMVGQNASSLMKAP